MRHKECYLICLFIGFVALVARTISHPSPLSSSLLAAILVPYPFITSSNVCRDVFLGLVYAIRPVLFMLVYTQQI